MLSIIAILHIQASEGVSAVGLSPLSPFNPDLPEPGLQLARGVRLPQLRRAAEQLAAEEDQRNPLIPARVLPACIT